MTKAPHNIGIFGVKQYWITNDMQSVFSNSDLAMFESVTLPTLIITSFVRVRSELQWIRSELAQTMAVAYSAPGQLSIVPLGTNLSEILIKNTKLFIHKNASKIILCEILFILFRWEMCG